MKTPIPIKQKLREALEFSLFQWILASLAENMNPCYYSIVKYMIK